jgi:hypothetical protein
VEKANKIVLQPGVILMGITLHNYVFLLGVVVWCGVVWCGAVRCGAVLNKSKKKS